jgi:uncharacterized protein (TIGR03435 family)
MKSLVCTVALAVLAVFAVAPTTAQMQSPLSFEVASVKPNNSGDMAIRFEPPTGGLFVITNAPLREIIRVAYSVQDSQLVGLPDWTRTARFDINARAGRDITFNGTLQDPISPAFLMLRSLLSDRFNLVLRRETRDMAAYALVVARPDGKLGPKLRLSTTDCAKPDAAKPAGDGALRCGARNARGQIVIAARPLKLLADMLVPRMARPVIDQTGLTDLYDAVIDFVPDVPAPASQPGPSVPVPTGANDTSLQTALEEQLGLKLQAIKTPVEVLVVESISRPTPD